MEADRVKAISNSKLATLGEMASGMAHEINNPLAILLSRVTIMKEQLERAEYGKIKDGLTRTEDTIFRISKIIKGLKTFSRNAEKDPFLSTPIKTIIEDTLELCRQKFSKEQVELKLNLIPDVTIDCRASQITQVLVNLINNAYDAIHKENGAWIEIDVIEMIDTVTISVTDSGKGIPADVAEKIMQPFFTTKEVGKGTGLGLSISKGIIEDHQGHLTLDRHHANTRFVIEIPINLNELEKAA